MRFTPRSLAAVDGDHCFEVAQVSDESWSASVRELDEVTVVELGQFPTREAAEAACDRAAKFMAAHQASRSGVAPVAVGAA